MGKIVASFFISLDGVVESPHLWHFPYFDEDMAKAVGASIDGSQGVLMGLQLYRDWSAHFPDSDDEFAGFINNVPKYVISHEDFVPTWANTTVLSGHHVGAQVADLKAATDGNLTMSGSATTVRWLMAKGLLDELQLLVHPIAVGRGKRLFEGTSKRPLNLLRHEVFPSGVLHLTYAPVRPADLPRDVGPR